MFTMKDGSFYQSNPQNFRGIIDKIEKLGLKARNNGIKDAIKDDDVKTLVAGEFGKVLAGSLMNNESTDGFKQHILRSEDAAHVNTIIIKKDKIKFVSKSGESTTSVKKL